MQKEIHISETVWAREVCLTFSKKSLSQFFRTTFKLNSNCVFQKALFVLGDSVLAIKYNRPQYCASHCALLKPMGSCLVISFLISFDAIAWVDVQGLKPTKNQFPRYMNMKALYKVICQTHDIKSKCHIFHISWTNYFFGKIKTHKLHLSLKVV